MSRAKREFGAVVFDLDGTLIDTVPDSMAALNTVLADCGLRRLSLEEVRKMVGHGAAVMLQRAFALVDRERSAGEIDHLVEKYLEAYLADPVGHTVIYPQAFETLDVLRLKKMKLGICTNKPKASTHVVLEKLGLAGLFAAVLCPEDVAFRKPDGRHLLATLEALDASPNEAIYIGDSETDIAAAKDAGVMSIFVSWGYCHVASELLEADARIDHFADLPGVLDVLASRTA